MSELGAAGIATALQGRYEIRDEAPVHSLATELFPMVGASDELMDPELHFPSGSRLGWMRTTSTPAAGQFAAMHLTNNPGTGVIAVLDRLDVELVAAAGSRFEVALEGGPLSAQAGAAGFVRDSRYGWSSARTTLTGGGVSLAALPVASTVTPLSFPLDQFQMRTLLQKLVLAPQSRVWVWALTADLPIRANWLWRERKIESGELRNTR